MPKTDSKSVGSPSCGAAAAHVAYIKVGAGRVAQTREETGNIMLDLDSKGHLLGVEIIASKSLKYETRIAAVLRKIAKEFGAPQLRDIDLKVVMAKEFPMATLIDLKAYIASLQKADHENAKDFHAAVVHGMETLRLLDSDLAHQFGVSRPTVDRWRSGANAPHAAMRKVVFAWLEDRASALRE